MTPDELRSALARAEVGLIETPLAVRRLELATLVQVLRELAESDDPKLRASVPCLLAVQAGDAAEATEAAAGAATAEVRQRLGLLYRIARALVISREPDLVHVLGRRPALPEIALEPPLPDPTDDFGERCLSVAYELHARDVGGNPVGDVIDLFDQWLRLAVIERRGRRREEVNADRPALTRHAAPLPPE